MSERFSRNELYWGKDFQEFLKSLHIAVFGLGGVGGFALEALARSGIENFTIVDFDTVSQSNINRQLIALSSTVGLKKTEAFKQRLYDINSNIKLKIFDEFYCDGDNDKIFENKIDFVLDAIDTLRSKIALIKYCSLNNVKIISSMGAGNRVCGDKLYVCDISEIKSKCNFVKNIISKLKKENIEKDLTVVVSLESPKSLQKIKNTERILKTDGTSLEFVKFTPASTPVVPAIAGYLAADYIINYYLNSFKNS